MTEDFFRTIDAHPMGRITAGWKPASAGVPTMRAFPQYVLLLTAGGRAWFRDATGRRATLGSGDVLVLVPGVAHAFAPEPGTIWDEFYLIFSGPAFVPWFDQRLLSSDRPILHVDPVAYWLARFRGIADVTDVHPPYAAIARLHTLIADLLTHADGAGRSAADRAWLTQACSQLGSDSRPSLELIAHRLKCSSQIFRKRFRALAGIPPGAWRERRRLDAACDLLRTHPVAVVASRLGFCDPFHFSRRFRQRHGISPQGFRRAVRS